MGRFSLRGELPYFGIIPERLCDPLMALHDQ
jgi:hypothetical protein